MANIQLRDIDLDFHVRATGHISLKEFLARGLFRRRHETWRTVHSLRDISLTITRGERVGIIGANGAGKSTLLKLFCGVYEPTRGARRVTGSISSLFDLRLGFEMDATGWENMEYRAYFQGETPKSLAAKRDAIAEFSELGDFLDLPIRTYSAGMIVRLGFAIATAIKPEILVVDEVLAAGDRAFAEKARRRIHELIHHAAIVILVSHDLNSLASLVDRVIWMDAGRIRQDGPTREVIQAYCEAAKAQGAMAA
jgi:lipopolysaccharide transport system ATP-binding protein